MGDVLLREHAYIERVVVSLHIVTGEGVIGLAGHALVAIGLRYEAVKGRNNIGELLRTVQTEIAGGLVHFIFYSVRRNYFDENPDFVRTIGAEVDPVPRMCFVVVGKICHGSVKQIGYC